MRRGAVDYPLLLAVLCLMALGVVIVYSASAVKAGVDRNDWEYFLNRQLLFCGAGLVVLLAASATPYTFWENKVGLAVLGTLALLVAVLFLARGSNGAYRWIPLGPVNLQPSEFAKLTVALYLARYLARRGGEVRHNSAGLLRPMAVVGAIALLVLAERDLGTAVFILLLALSLLFVAGVRGRVLLAGLLAVTVLAGAAIAAEPYRRQRLVQYLEGVGAVAGEERRGPTQVDQSLAAIANGGALGKGLGQGDSKRLFLPEAHTDFILAVVGEELGAPGVLGVLGLFALVVWRGLSIARSAPEPFACLLAAGITLVIGYGALANAMMVTGIIPPKGIALPLVSYGGSSLLASLLGAGVLLSIGGRRAAA